MLDDIKRTLWAAAEAACKLGSLRKYAYPPDQPEAAIELVRRQTEALGEAWA